MVNIKQIFNEKDLEMFDMEEKSIIRRNHREYNYFKKAKKVDIYLMSKNNITETILEKIEKITLKHLKVNKIKINWEKLDDLKKVKSLVSKGWSQFLGQLSQRFPAATSLLQNSDWKLDGDCIYVYLEQSGIKLLKEQSIHSFTENILNV